MKRVIDGPATAASPTDDRSDRDRVSPRRRRSIDRFEIRPVRSPRTVFLVQELVDEARATDPVSFEASFGRHFLLKPPALEADPWEAPMRFDTISLPMSALGGPVGAHLSEAGLDAAWLYAPLKKSDPDAAFADHISVGRAQSCDIVLRLPYVSKLHARFHTTEAGLQLVDYDSANGTRVNGRQLAPREAEPVKPGDDLHFGKLSVRLVDAATLQRMLVEALM